MADSDHTTPWHVRVARGEDSPGTYVRRVTKDCGRRRAWGIAARAMGRANRHAARRAMARGDEPAPYKARGASWRAY